MRVLVAFIAISVLSGCSKTVNVPEGKYGLVFYLGKIENVIEGPAQANMSLVLGNMQYVNKREEINLGNGAYIIYYEVLDPKEYYIKTAGGSASYIEQKVKDIVAKMSLSGTAIKSKNQLIEIIEEMKLPIKIDKNV